MRAILKLANSRYRQSKHDWWRMQETVLYFQRETQKAELKSDTMLRHQRADVSQPATAAALWRWCWAADAPQPAGAAAPVIALVASLHVCFCSGSATAPSEIWNDCRCVVEVPAASHFCCFNQYNADSDCTLIKCAGYNMRWCSDVFHHNGDDNEGKLFKYGMEGSGYT